jgi:hypothetical protein
MGRVPRARGVARGIRVWWPGLTWLARDWVLRGREGEARWGSAGGMGGGGGFERAGSGWKRSQDERASLSREETPTSGRDSGTVAVNPNRLRAVPLEASGTDDLGRWVMPVGEYVDG